MHAGQMEYLDMFKAAYTAAIRHYKDGPWYPSADIWRGSHTQIQFTSLQAFWPGENILIFLSSKVYIQASPFCYCLMNASHCLHAHWYLR